MADESVTTSRLLLSAYTGVFALLVYLVILAVYRLYFHPLARFPGPKLAALTRWYEFYYDVICGGRYIFKIQELHEYYGPIVRITPFEVHVSDPTFFDVICSQTKKRDKYAWTNLRFGIPDSLFSTTQHDLHRLRRAPLNPMFSKQKILNFEPYIQERIDVMFRVFKGYAGTERILRLDHAFSAFSGDVISEFAFATPFNLLESPDFQGNLHPAFQAAARSIHATLHFPWLFPLMQSLPPQIVVKLEPDLADLLKLQAGLAQQVEDIRSGKNEAYKTAKHPTLFRELLESGLPEREKEPLRIKQEAQNIIGAGLETVAWALAVGTFYILSSPSVEDRLKKELRVAIPEPNDTQAFSWQSLQKLPYLRGCILESLRLSYGVTGRLIRTAPDEVLVYDGWKIPANTAISTNIYAMNHNEAYFPDSYAFEPDRWEDGNLEKYLFTFSRGTRQCMGLNLAQAELYKTMAMIFRRFHFELYQTDVSDVELQHDFFLPNPKSDSNGVRVKVVKVE